MDDNRALEWNINMGWLDYINKLIISYGMSRLSDDYNGMYKSLDLLEQTASPKIDNDKSEENLKAIKKNIRKMIKRDENGNVVRYYPELIDETEDLFGETYSLILKKLDAKGLLTKKRDDPAHAMGRFGGS